MYGKFQEHLRHELDEIRAAGLYKDERIITSPQNAEIEVRGGRKVLNLCANNYLGLADHPEVVKAAQEGSAKRGYGLSSVRFICGTQDIHKELENKISAFLGTDDTILYGSCFDANGGLFETLLGPEDAVISDALNHASIIDGIRLCKAQRFRYKNNDMADLETQRLLFGDTALAKGAQPTPTPDPNADLGDINDVVMVEDGASTPDSLGTSEYGGHKLQRGAQGEEVKQVQTRLTELGFFTGPISGNYMNQTIAAVKAFQEHNGMFVTGETDEETWNMLFNSSDVLDVSATARPTPVPTPVPYAITVDVRNQVTIVYGLDENGEYTVPVKQMVCSTGMKATPSDVGEWVLNGRKARWCYFPTWGSHAQYWTRINDSIAFHSVIYNSVDLNNMSTKSYNLLGSRASHGCIRLLVSDAKWIYDNVGEGVVVTVTEDLPDDEELRKAVAAPPLNSSKTGPVTTPEPTPAPEYVSGGTPPQPFEKLKKGTESEAVYWLQCRLKELGYYTGTITGGYYSGTQKAVKAFQKANGIYPTGTADVETLEAIYADVLDAQATPPVTPTPEPTPEPTPSPTPSPTTEPGKTSSNNA